MSFFFLSLFEADDVPSHSYEEVVDRNFKLEFANEMEDIEDGGRLYRYETGEIG